MSSICEIYKNVQSQLNECINGFPKLSFLEACQQLKLDGYPFSVVGPCTGIVHNFGSQGGLTLEQAESICADLSSASCSFDTRFSINPQTSIECMKAKLTECKWLDIPHLQLQDDHIESPTSPPAINLDHSSDTVVEFQSTDLQHNRGSQGGEVLVTGNDAHDVYPLSGFIIPMLTACYYMM